MLVLIYCVLPFSLFTVAHEIERVVGEYKLDVVVHPFHNNRRMSIPVVLGPFKLQEEFHCVNYSPVRS